MTLSRIHDPDAVGIADEIVALLTLYQQLQSEKDGRAWPAQDQYSRDENEFTDHIRVACRHALQLRQLLPMTTTLSAIGTEMEHRGEIRVMTGDD